MAVDRTRWFLDERLIRHVFAAAATFIAVGSIATRNNPAVDWSLTTPIVVVYWLWAQAPRHFRLMTYLLGLSMPLVLNIIESESEVSMFIAVLTVALVTSHESNRALVAVAVGSTIALMLLFAAVVYDDFAWQNWTFGLLFSAGAGALVFNYQKLIEDLQQARAVVADQAAVNERRRIARDVHDLVGHSLSVVMLHVTGARHLLRKDPDEAERALEQAEEAGRQSLAEIRRTVGLLRDERDGESAALPSPDLGDVASLVAEFEVAGLDVVLQSEGPLDLVDPAIALAGYRIVQEALTNASRHNDGAHVQVTIAVLGDRCDLGVRNQGGVATDAAHGAGFGLVSMRERARSVGGSLIVGPIASGWAVEASLPVSSNGSGT